MLKTFLKNARQALAEKDNVYAISQSQSALEIDPSSYNAYVFLGLAYTNQEDYVLAEKHYDKAIKLDEQNVLAWQGLLSMLEKSAQFSKYIDTTSRLADIYARAGDEEKCFNVIDKAINFVRQNGSSVELTQALKLILPISPFFNILQDRLPDAADTYEELCALLEREESTRISTAIAKGRSRLGVKLEDLTADIKATVFAQSELESIYTEIINWSHEEAVRRSAEDKLLAHTIDHLRVAADKELLRQKAIDIARGMTIVKVANMEAWTIVLDWTDLPLESMELAMIHLYVTLFPSSLSLALRDYVYSSISPFSEEEAARYFERGDLDDQKFLKTLLDAHNSSADSMLCLRLLLAQYVHLQDWKSVIDYAEVLLDKVLKLEHETSVELINTRSSAELYLAKALTIYRAPRFHLRAAELFESLIENKLLLEAAEIGKARLLRISGSPAEARLILQKYATEEAKLELAQCYLASGQPQDALDLLRDLQGSRQTLASIHYFIGQCQKQLGGDEYGSYIQSLRYDANLASTYTALGIYYADTAKDIRRAEKCFQKALELSSAEVDAAERLASSFADSEEWDLVEIIATRVIQGNEQLSVSWPYRAIGIVHLSLGKSQMAVSAFQSCLRLSTKDVDAWVGLGEAYLELGRHQAAKKALLRAIMLNDSDWHAKYLAATVSSLLGDHEQACEQLRAILAIARDETILVSLITAYIAWAESLFEQGYISKAVSLLYDCLDLVDNSPILIELGAQVLSHLNQYAQPSGVFDAFERRVYALHGDSDKILEHQNLSERYRACAVHALRFNLPYIKNPDHEASLWYSIGKLSIGDTQSILAFQHAIQLQPENAAAWSGLAFAAMADLQFAHHCLIKASILTPRSAVCWTNLAYFYLKNDAFMAANEAFSEAQKHDPAYALAWLGQALTSSLLGEADHELYAHALQLSVPTQSPIIAVKNIESSFDSGLVQIDSVLWTIEQAKKSLASLELDYNRLLVLERAGKLSMNDAERIVQNLEAIYEAEESSTVLTQYCDAKSLLARLQLKDSQYESALETAEEVLSLEPENADKSLLCCRVIVAVTTFIISGACDLADLENDGSSFARLAYHYLLLNSSRPTVLRSLAEKTNDDIRNKLEQQLSATEARKLVPEQMSHESLLAKLHIEPSSSATWLEDLTGQLAVDTAKKVSRSTYDYATACKASDSYQDRLVGLHLVPFS